MAEVKGTVDPKFSRVADLLAEHVEAGKEVGASIYLNIGGQEVIDIWGGWSEREQVRPWSAHTMVNVFSGTKTVTSLALLMLVDRGLLDVNAPVAKYWPEFAQNGKEGVLVRHLMSHTAGLPGWEPPFTYSDAMNVAQSTARLAAQAAWWEPGARGSYHASTFGHLNSELFRRASGIELSAFVDAELAGPMNADFELGLPGPDYGNIATIYPDEDEAAPAPAVKVPLSEQTADEIISTRTRAGSFSGTMGDPLTVFNSPEWRATEFAGSSGHSNARGLGRINSLIANGGSFKGKQFVSPETIALIFRQQANGIDAYYRRPIRWGIGYALAPLESKQKGPLPFILPSKRTSYWYGTGGAMAIADAERGITMGYAMNQCQSGRKQLNGLYYNAIYECLGII